MAVTFNNTVYGSGFVGQDDGAPTASTRLDSVSTNNITVNGTITNAGDPVTVTGLLPGGATTRTTNTLYATQYDSAGLIELSDSATPNANSNRYFLSNSALTSGQRVTLNSDPSLSQYQPVCFVMGTLIRTVRGEVAVEDLRIGDEAVTAAGAVRPIVWIGHRTLDCRRVARPEAIMPVRIAAHAFGEGRPARDLLVSPGHAIGLDVMGEVLIPAGLLLNGTTITQDVVETVTYWHIELESHDLLVAENQPSESYLDMGNRGFFAESQVVAFAGEPDGAVRTHADFCRPYHDGGALLDAVRMQLRRRNEEQGWRLVEPAPFAGVHLEVDGQIVQATVDGLSARFALPAGAKEVWLVAPTSVPFHVGLTADGRPLGLCLGRLSFDDGAAARRAIALDDPRLCVGLHAAEADHRWTAGRTRLPASLWDGLAGPVGLCLELHRPSLPRWVKPASPSAAALAA